MFRFLRQAGASAIFLFAAGKAVSSLAGESLVDWSNPPVASSQFEEVRLVNEEQFIGDEGAIQKRSGGCDIEMCECCPPIWYASVGAVILQRSRPAPGIVVATNPGGAEISNADDFDFAWSAGVDVTLARRLGNGDILEARFFQVDSNDTNTFVTPSGFIGAGFTGPGGTNFAGEYITRLYSTELNYRRAWSDQLTILGGFRMLEVNDDMIYRLNGNVATGQYEYNNYLYGAQIGADLALTDRANPFQLNVVGKAGYYGNFVAGGIFEFQANNFIGSFTGQETFSAFVGEVGISGAYQITSCLAVRAGYQLLWVNNVALGSDAAARSLLNPSLLNNVETGDLFYHGATIAVDVVW